MCEPPSKEIKNHTGDHGRRSRERGRVHACGVMARVCPSASSTNKRRKRLRRGHDELVAGRVVGSRMRGAHFSVVVMVGYGRGRHDRGDQPDAGVIPIRLSNVHQEVLGSPAGATRDGASSSHALEIAKERRQSPPGGSRTRQRRRCQIALPLYHGRIPAHYQQMPRPVDRADMLSLQETRDTRIRKTREQTHERLT